MTIDQTVAAVLLAALETRQAREDVRRLHIEWLEAKCAVKEKAQAEADAREAWVDAVLMHGKTAEAA